MRLSETTTLMSLKAFCQAVVSEFGEIYLRSPSGADLVNVERSFAEVGFPGCIGCVDCAGRDWDACPKAH